MMPFKNRMALYVSVGLLTFVVCYAIVFSL